jgi:hypothetical protein
MAQLVTYELTTATVNVSMLGLPKATGFVQFTVSVHTRDMPGLELKGTDLRLGKGTLHTVKYRTIYMANVLEEPSASERYRMKPRATVSGRAATEQIQERLRDVALAALSALTQNSGFAEWFIAATAENLRDETIKDLKRRIEHAKKSLVNDEHALQAYRDIIVTVGPLPVEQLEFALILRNRINRTKQALTGDERELQQCQDIVDAVGPLTNEQLKMALTLTKSNHSLGTAIEAARKI